MNLFQRIFPLTLSVVVMLFILELLRRKKLSEKLSVTWLVGGGFIFLASINQPTFIVFFLGILFLILLSIQISVMVSENHRKIKILTQKFAIYENRFDALKSEFEELRMKLKL